MAANDTALTVGPAVQLADIPLPKSATLWLQLASIQLIKNNKVCQTGYL